jgi:hypothetical protein
VVLEPLDQRSDQVESAIDFIDLPQVVGGFDVIFL